MRILLLIHLCIFTSQHLHDEVQTNIRKSMSIKRQHGLHGVLNYSRPVILLKVSLGANVQFEMVCVTSCFFWQLSQSKWYAFFNIKNSLQNRSIEHLRTCVFLPPCVFEVLQDTEDNTLKNKHFKITAHWKIPWKQSLRCCANPPKEGSVLLKRCLCSI